MNWSDYEAVWKRQEPPVGSRADLATLRDTFEPKRRKMAAAIKVRDWAEASAGLVGSAGFALIWWQQGKAGWPISLAIILVLGVTGFFVRERLRAHRNRLSADATLLAKLDSEIAELRHQRQLLMSLGFWYLAPCALAIVIVGTTIALNRRPGDLARDPIFLGAFGLFFAFFLWFAWEINRRAVKKQIDPRIEELEKLHHELLGPPAPTGN